jgi:hypothetical protein
MTKIGVLLGWAVGLAGFISAETVTNNLDVQGGFIYNHGAVNPGDIGMTFTNAGIRDITISAGQLSGVDPETGAVITNAVNLLPLKVQSLTTVGDIVTGGKFIGDGSELTNLNISSSSLPTSGVWNAAGMTITNATLTGHVSVSSLTVQGEFTAFYIPPRGDIGMGIYTNGLPQ